MTSMHAVVFVNPEFNQEWPPVGSNADPNSIVWGQDVAEFLREQLCARGVDICEGQPVEGEGGWTLWVRKNGISCIVFFHWAPIGKPPDDYWVVQVRPRHGLVALITGRRTQGDTAAYEVALTIRDVVQSLEGSRDVQLVDEHGFGRLY